MQRFEFKDRGDRPTVTRFAYDRGQSPCPEASPERFVPTVAGKWDERSE
ncbi:MAG: hypothetical protein J6A07_07715 [Firmicutes bacterium]|nr:hypothetical protein [Bacillota bacterium]